MKLEEKGPIQAPPKLDRFSQEVSSEIQSWKDIIAATHWDLYNRTKPDGADFYVGDTELGHIHLNGEVHLACGKKLAALLIKSKLASKFLYGADWVTYSIQSAEDVQHAIWLFKLNYRQIKGESLEVLVREIEQ
jgi:Family of unknown function (DUF5519)